jgi:PBP1b-binding outer membrane lipoprotein LpoB
MKLTTKLLTLSAIVFLALMLDSCSSSKKMKKKCLDCPEFSFNKTVQVPSQVVNENI